MNESSRLGADVATNVQSQKIQIDDLAKKHPATSSLALEQHIKSSDPAKAARSSRQYTDTQRAAVNVSAASTASGPAGTNWAVNSERKEAQLEVGADGKASAVSAAMSAPVVRASNIDLQSQLRNLLKCGNSSNIQNPFTARKIISPTVEGTRHN